MKAKNVRWILEMAKYVFAMFVVYPIVITIWCISKKRKKTKSRRRLFTEIPQSNHKIIPKREPVVVMTNKYSSGSEDKPNINNVFPGRKYKVVSKPFKWEGFCRFIDQIGQCVGTDRVHGAKLKFISGEICSIPFENVELHEAYRYQAPVNNPPVVAVEPEKGKYYKVIKKPSRWKTPCKYIDQTGICILVDERGARLHFNSDGAGISFPSDCIREAEAIDLNKSTSEITEDSVQIGDIFRVIKSVNKYGVDAKKLVGKIGKAIWANYRGVCMKFSDKSGYVIPFDCLEKYYPQQPPNPVNVPKSLNANNIVIHRKYKVYILPQDFDGDMKILGQLGKVMWASDVSRGVMLHFDDGYEKLVPFSCIQDLPRPSEEELVALIKQHPEKVLRIIKGLSRITKLKPVIDFVQGGQLPVVEPEIPPQIYGPYAPPACMSETTLNPFIGTAGTIGEVCDEMMNRVVAMIEREDSPRPNISANCNAEYSEKN